MPERQRFSGFDGKLPQRQLTLLAQGDAEKIRFAYRDTARGQAKVDILQLSQPGPGSGQIICEDARINHFTTQALQPAAQQHTITVVDLPRSQGLAGFDQFVPRGQDGYANPAYHLQLSTPQGGSQALFDRAQARTGAQDQLTDSGFLALWANVLARLQGLSEMYALIRLNLCVFLHLDTVGTRRHGRASKNPCAGTGLQGQRCLAGKNLLADHHRLASPVGQAQRIPVHGTVGPGWQIQRRDQIVSQYPPFGVRQRQTFTLTDRRGLGHGQQSRQRFLDRHQTACFTWFTRAIHRVPPVSNEQQSCRDDAVNPAVRREYRPSQCALRWSTPVNSTPACHWPIRPKHG